MELKERIFGLDLMRAAAILMVLVGHCSWIYPNANPTIGSLLALAGFMGVEFFFVLSGFLIGRILYRQFTEGDFNSKSVLLFLRRRWFRTFPNYFLILLVNIAIAFFVSAPLEYGWTYFLFLQNFAWPMPPFFTESWSLSVEEFAYLFLPFTLWAAVSFVGKANKSRVFLFVTMGLIAVFIIAKLLKRNSVSGMSLEQWNVGIKSVVVYRLDSIFIGVLAGWVCDNFSSFWKKTKGLWFFAGLLMMGFFTVGVGYFQLLIDNYLFFWTVLYLPLFSFGVAFFLPIMSRWKTAVPQLSNPITFLSRVSYSIYLLHYGVVLQIMKQLTDTSQLSAGPKLLFVIGYLSATIFLSHLLFRYYEKPMMDKREKWNKIT